MLPPTKIPERPAAVSVVCEGSSRRAFLRDLTLAGAVTAVAGPRVIAQNDSEGKAAPAPPPPVEGERAYWVRTLEAEGTFDADGWLQIGLAGHQPSLGEPYISTGSLYLCTFAFHPLGRLASAPFWRAPAIDWTQRRVWSGQNQPADHALKGK